MKPPISPLFLFNQEPSVKAIFYQTQQFDREEHLTLFVLSNLCSAQQVVPTIFLTMIADIYYCTFYFLFSLCWKSFKFIPIRQLLGLVFRFWYRIIEICDLYGLLQLPFWSFDILSISYEVFYHQHKNIPGIRELIIKIKILETKWSRKNIHQKFPNSTVVTASKFIICQNRIRWHSQVGTRRSGRWDHEEWALLFGQVPISLILASCIVKSVQTIFYLYQESSWWAS